MGFHWEGNKTAFFIPRGILNQRMHMNAISLAPGVLTMSSREVADLTGKDHDNVRRDIRHMAETLSLSFEEKTEASEGGRPAKVFVLPKRESLILVSGYSIELRAKIIDRWQELEASAGPVLPKTMAQALRLAADQAEQIEAQQALLEQQRPAVEFVERYTDSTGNKGFREVCKLLKAKENAFRAFLLERKVMYRLAGVMTPYADHLDAGRFEVKTGSAEHGDSSHAFNQAKFTPKGVAWIAGEWAKHNLPTA